jgi:D-Tyr-tRNAtyr deacylase
MTPASAAAIGKARVDSYRETADLLASSLRTLLAHTVGGATPTALETETAREAIDIYDHLHDLSRTDEAKN